jgi:hypothetical protein
MIPSAKSAVPIIDLRRISALRLLSMVTTFALNAFYDDFVTDAALPEDVKK